MARFGFSALGFVSVLALGSVFATGAQAVLGGSGAPQSEHCKSVGGTEDGSFCVLENGDYCDSMTLFREGVCKGPDGAIIEEEDFGSNEVIEGDDSGDSEE
jgi:putative hemolysin